MLNPTLISFGPDSPQSPSIYYVGTYVGICMFGSTTREFKGCALALSDVHWCLGEEKILRCQLAMRTLNNAGAVELTIYLVKMPVRRRPILSESEPWSRRFRSDFLNIWRCSFAFNASSSHLHFLGTKVHRLNANIYVGTRSTIDDTERNFPFLVSARCIKAICTAGSACCDVTVVRPPEHSRFESIP